MQGITGTLPKGRESKLECGDAERPVRSALETVHLDVGLGSDTFLHDERGDLLTLVTLKLDNLSELLVVNNGTVACEFLLEGLQQLLLIILCKVAECEGKATMKVAVEYAKCRSEGSREPKAWERYTEPEEGLSAYSSSGDMGRNTAATALDNEVFVCTYLWAVPEEW